jgi:hypothetical protein
VTGGDSGDRAVARVVAVAAPVGGGKTTLVRGLAEHFSGASTVYFDHYERITEQSIESIGDWMREGADLNRIVVPGLAEDLQSLKRGVAVTDPLTRSAIASSEFILFETQFGRAHAASGQHIDYLVWLDIPLDIALARKIRQFSGEVAAGRDSRRAAEFAPWLGTYLENYIAVVGKLLRLQRDLVAANADLVLDGMLDPRELQRRAAEAILGRFA